MIKWTSFGTPEKPKLYAKVRGLIIGITRHDGVWFLTCEGLFNYEKIVTGFTHCAKRIALHKVLQAMELRQLEDTKRIEEIKADMEEW